MLQGQDSKGKPITYQGRSRYSAGYAKRQGRPVSPIILKDTGSFQRNTYAEVMPDIVKFDSTDPKTAMLKKKSGEDIFGLNEANLDKIRDICQTELIEIVKEKLHL